MSIVLLIICFALSKGYTFTDVKPNIYDDKTVSIIGIDESSAFLIREKIVQMFYNQSPYKETNSKYPIDCIDSNNFNIAYIPNGLNTEIFYRCKEKLIHQKLGSNEVMLDKTVENQKKHYQLIYVEHNSLIDTEVSSNMFQINLIDYKGNFVVKDEIENSYSTNHWVIALRNGNIIAFTPKDDMKLLAYIFTNKLKLHQKQEINYEFEKNYLKAYELDDNDLVVCCFSKTILYCRAATYDINSNSLKSMVLVTVLTVCDEKNGYYISPIGQTGQAVAMCVSVNEKYLQVVRFSRNKLRSAEEIVNYNYIYKMHGILHGKQNVFYTMVYAKFTLTGRSYIMYEPFTSPSCQDYSMILIEDTICLHRKEIMSDDSIVIEIVKQPIKGKIINNMGLGINDCSPNKISYMFYKRGESGFDSFRYEIKYPNEEYSLPCLITVEVKCEAHCKTCSKMGNDLIQECITCHSGVMQPLYNNINLVGNCQSDCDSNYLPNSMNQCIQCSNKCIKCYDKPTENEDKCLICKDENPFHLKINDSYNCYSSCPLFYYANLDKECLPCHSSCNACSKGPDGFYQNCSQCKVNDFKLFFDPNDTNKFNCYTEKCPDNYLETNKECLKCHDNCKTCTMTGNDEFQCCSSCNPNKFLFINSADGKHGNCASECPGNSFTNDQDQCINCYEKCGTCQKKGNDMLNACLSCQDINKKILLFRESDLSGNCVDSCIDGSYERDNNCIKCMAYCSTCNKSGTVQKHNCLKCIPGLLEQPYENLPSLDSPPDTTLFDCLYECKIGYYTNDYISCQKCYSTCRSCVKGGTMKDNNCEICIKDYINHPTVPGNCVFNCKINNKRWYFDEFDNHQCTPTEQCPSDYPLYEPGYGQCVKSCIHDSQCIECQKQLKLFQQKNKCLAICDEFYTSDKNNICIRDPIPNLSPPNVLSNGIIDYNTTEIREIFIKDMRNILKKAIDHIIDSGKNDTVVVVTREDDYQFIVSQLGAQLSNSTLGSTINFEHCEDKIRERYDIPTSESLYVCQLIYPETDKPLNALQYGVYDERAKELNLKWCNNTNITIYQHLTIDENLLIEAKRLMDLSNVDPFNPESEFYQNVCFNYSDLVGNDYTLSSRQKKFIDDNAFCSIDCQYKGINHHSNTAICDCMVSEKEISSVISSNYFVNSIMSTFPLSNMVIFTCPQKFFVDNNLSRNYGFMVIIIFQLLQIIFFILFATLQMNAMFIKYTPNPNTSNPPKKDNLNDGYNSNRFNKSEISTAPNKDTHLPIDLTAINQSINKNCYNNNNEVLNEKEDKESAKEIQIKTYVKKITLSTALGEYSQDEINEMEYDDALENDKRSFIKCYWYLLKTKEVIFTTIHSEEIFNPFLQRIYICLFLLSTYLFVNALFYTDAFITTNSNFEPLFLFNDELEKSFYAAVIIHVISKSITSLLGLDRRIRKAYKDNKTEYKSKLDGFFKKQRRNIFILFGITLLIDLVMIYYVTIFCRLYPNNQGRWFISTVISMVMNIILSVFLCLIMAITRYVALRYKKEVVYKASSYISELM